MNRNQENGFLPDDLIEALNFVRDYSLKNEEKQIFLMNKTNKSNIVKQSEQQNIKKNKPFQRPPKKSHKIIQHAIELSKSASQSNEQLRMSDQLIKVQSIAGTTKIIPKFQSTKPKIQPSSYKPSLQMSIPISSFNGFQHNQQQFTKLLNQQLQKNNKTKFGLSCHKTTDVKVSSKQSKTPSTIIYNSLEKIVESNIVSQRKEHHEKQQQLDDMIDKWRGCYEYLSSFDNYNINNKDSYHDGFRKNKMKLYDFTTNFNNNNQQQQQQTSSQQSSQQSIQFVQLQKKFNHPPPSNSSSKPNYKQKLIKQTPLKYSLSTSQTSAKKQNNANKQKTKQSQQTYSKLSKSILSSQNKQNSQQVINPQQMKHLNNFKYLDVIDNNQSNHYSYQNLTYLQQNMSSLDSNKYLRNIKNDSELDYQQSFVSNNLDEVKKFNMPSKTVLKNLNHFH